jgi:hypothetical protein
MQVVGSQILDVSTFGSRLHQLPDGLRRYSIGGWPRLLISMASPTQRGAPSFAFLAKGGYDAAGTIGFAMPAACVALRCA